MTTPVKTAVVMVGGMLWLLLLGFVLFAARVNREPDDAQAHADAIVVLTGGPTRIVEGARLLADQRAERLLISGINPQTGRESVLKLTQLVEPMFDCCVDLDYAAKDTIGNATETRKWVTKHHYNRLIVVTSRYHMPRSMVELQRALPGVELIAHAVPAAKDPVQPWWLDATTTRVIVSEYVKFLPAAARLIVARTFGSWDESSVAEGAKPPHAKTSGL